MLPALLSGEDEVKNDASFCGRGRAAGRASLVQKQQAQRARTLLGRQGTLPDWHFLLFKVGQGKLCVLGAWFECQRQSTEV